VDTRRSPQWVRPAHFANKGAQLTWDPRSADAIARSPAPIGPKASTVPANDRLRPDDRKGACGRGEPAIEANKQKAIDICQSRPLWHPSTKHVDLLPEDQILCLQFGSRLKQRCENGKKQPEQVGHQAASLPRSFLASTPNRIFGTHSRFSARGIDLVVIES